VQALLERPEIRQEVGWQQPRPPFIDYVVILGAETTFPTKLVELVKVELEYNVALQLDFPEICGKGDIWKMGELVTKSGIKIESFGAEQAIRGTFHAASRPKLLLGDDLLTDQEAYSQTERDKRWNWYLRVVSFLGPPDGSVKALNAATILHSDDLVSRAKKTHNHTVHHFKAIEQLPNRMDLWEECEALMRTADQQQKDDFAKGTQILSQQKLPSYQFYQDHRYEMDAGAITSWPTVRSLYWLMLKRAEARRAFDTEMQGEPSDNNERVFYRYQFWSPLQRSPTWRYYGACDPSMGGPTERHNPSALLIGAWDHFAKKLYIVEAKIERRVPSKLFSDLIKLQHQYHCILWAFENNNAYEHMRQSFVQQGLLQQTPLPLVGITATVPPELRITSLEPYVTGIEPKIFFHPSLTNLLNELTCFPEPQSHHHYDGLTALHLLWSVAVSGASSVPKIRSAYSEQRTSFFGY
jgi:predicted phage terminase large subunit-like protein